MICKNNDLTDTYLMICNNLCIGHVSGIFLFKNNNLTDIFPIRVSGRIRHVSGIIFLFKNNDLTDTFPIRVSGRIGRVSVSITYQTRFITIFLSIGTSQTYSYH
jgi:hypothetical protein